MCVCLCVQYENSYASVYNAWRFVFFLFWKEGTLSFFVCCVLRKLSNTRFYIYEAVFFLLFYTWFLRSFSSFKSCNLQKFSKKLKHQPLNKKNEVLKPFVFFLFFFFVFVFYGRIMKAYIRILSRVTLTASYQPYHALVSICHGRNKKNLTKNKEGSIENEKYYHVLPFKR